MNDRSYRSESSTRTSATVDRASCAPAVTSTLESRSRSEQRPGPYSATGTTELSGSPMRPLAAAPPRANHVDRALIERATELLDGVEYLDSEELALTLESLRNLVCRLWPSVAAATVYHQSILANIESFLLSQESIDAEQASVLRGAVKDLGLTSIGEQHAEVIRSQFIDHGHKPLALLGNVNLADDD